MWKKISCIAFFLTGAVMFPSPSPAGDQLDDAIVGVQKRLRSDKMKETVALNGKTLKEGDVISQRKALLFFCDIRAKEVVLACLFSDVIRGTAVQECLGIFGPGDILDLYKFADSLMPRTVTTGGENIVAREAIVEKLAGRTSAILGIEHVRVSSFTPEGVREWWIKAIKTAKAKGYVSDLDAALNYLSKPAKP